MWRGLERKLCSLWHAPRSNTDCDRGNFGLAARSDAWEGTYKFGQLVGSCIAKKLHSEHSCSELMVDGKPSQQTSLCQVPRHTSQIS